MEKLMILYKTMMDDLRDAEMYYINAEKLKDYDPELCKYFMDLAKLRLTHYQEVKTKFKAQAEKISSDALDGKPVSEIAWDVWEDYNQDKYAWLKYKIESYK